MVKETWLAKPQGSAALFKGALDVVDLANSLNDRLGVIELNIFGSCGWQRTAESDESASQRERARARALEVIDAVCPKSGC